MEIKKQSPLVKVGRLLFYNYYALWSTVKSRIKRIEVLGIEMILHDSQSFTKPLEVHDFPCPKELDGFVHIGFILYKSKNIVVGGACLLLCRHILRQICNDIAFGLELASVEGNASRCLGPDADGVVHVVVAETACLYLLHRKVLGQLVNNCGYHFQVC